MKKIALITPLKDEMENIERFLKTLSSQTIFIDTLVIVENDSEDGSKEYLEKFDVVENIGNFKVINMNFNSKDYNLEFKYSEIVNEGFEFLKGLPDYTSFDFIGILDCDCFPEKHYYEKLLTLMEGNENLGITSGIGYTPEGKRHIADINWVKGNSRIWRRECLDQTGFPIEPSPDSITVALAHINGWETQTHKSAIVEAREVNDRMQDYTNFGQRSYYRGDTPIFALLKSIHFTFIKWKPKIGKDFLNGYFSNWFKRAPRIPIKKVRNYYRFYLIRKMYRRLFQ